MQEFINSVTEKLGIDGDTAKTAVGSLLSMIKGEGDGGAVKDLFAKLPGADALASQAGAGNAGGGLLGGIGDAIGKLGGGAASGLAGLASSGLSSDKIKDLVQMFVGWAKKVAGEDAVNKVIGSIPALKSMVG
jgi:hypothetical protein